MIAFSIVLLGVSDSVNAILGSAIHTSQRHSDKADIQEMQGL